MSLQCLQSSPGRIVFDHLWDHSPVCYIRCDRQHLESSCSAKGLLLFDQAWYRESRTSRLSPNEEAPFGITLFAGNSRLPVIDFMPRVSGTTHHSPIIRWRAHLQEPLRCKHPVYPPSKAFISVQSQRPEEHPRKG